MLTYPCENNVSNPGLSELSPKGASRTAVILCNSPQIASIQAAGKRAINPAMQYEAESLSRPGQCASAHVRLYRPAVDRSPISFPDISHLPAGRNGGVSARNMRAVAGRASIVGIDFNGAMASGYGRGRVWRPGSFLHYVHVHIRSKISTLIPNFVAVVPERKEDQQCYESPAFPLPLCSP